MKRFVFPGFLLLLSSFYLKAQQADTSFHEYQLTVPGSKETVLMKSIPGGTFTMGSPVSEKGRDTDEGPARKLRIDPFWMAAYETSYLSFQQFAQDVQLSQNSTVDAVTRPSTPYLDFTLGMGKTENFPANSVQQYGAIMFCRWLYKKTGVFYRLPTEAEWEYACRAGSETAYPFGSDSSQLKEYAWYAGNSDQKYHRSGLLKPNAWGLYDMLGNVGEWTLDQYKKDYFDEIGNSTENPVIVPTNRHPNTVKGGSYIDAAADLRSAARIPTSREWNKRDPQIPKSRWWNADAPFVGFRIVRPLKQPDAAEIETFFQTYLHQ